MRNRIAAFVAVAFILLGFGAATPAYAAGGPHYYAGYRQTLTPAQQALATGATIQAQTWAATTPADGSKVNFGEISVQKDGTFDQVVEAGYMNRNAASLPKLFVNYWNLGASGGINNGFTACISSAVAGCSLPAWILPNANLSNNGSYTLRWWYTHVGTSSEGWWLSVKPTGPIPTGKQEWIGYFAKAKWGGTPSSIGVIQVFGEAYDTATPPAMAMGTGTCPTVGGGALFSGFLINGLTAGDLDLDQTNVTSDPAYYNTATPSNTGFRYGGPADPTPPC